ETFLGTWNDSRIGIIPEPAATPAFQVESNELPRGEHRGNAETFAVVMQLWERLHLPYLQVADAMTDPRQKIEAYRRTITVDYACELAHQRLSATAAQLARTIR